MLLQFRGGDAWAMVGFLLSVVGLFWGAIIFDMVADLYGNTNGGRHCLGRGLCSVGYSCRSHRSFRNRDYRDDPRCGEVTRLEVKPSEGRTIVS